MTRASLAVALASAACTAPDASPGGAALSFVDLEPPGSAGGGPLARMAAGCAGLTGSLQPAIDAAADGAVIEVCAGTYREHLEISGKRLTLRSVSGAGATVIDAELIDHALSVTDGADVVVEGLTFRNGISDGTGGNVRCQDSNLVLRDSVFEDGSAAKGGGYGTNTCTGLVERSTFRFNSASTRGGGLYAGPGVSLVANTFEDNWGIEAGGAYLKDSYATVERNTFLRNEATEDDGGGLFIMSGAPFIDRNVFEENISNEEGGGLRIRSGSSNISNNVLIANHADWRGGGAKLSHDEGVWSGNLFMDNTTYGYGGAVLLFESASLIQGDAYLGNEGDEGGAIAVLEGWGSVTFEDCVFEDNVADEGGHLYIDLLGYKTKLYRTTLLRGEAEYGGAIYATSESALETLSLDKTGIHFENTLFADNVADVAGGTMYLDNVEGEVLNSVVVRSDAPAGSGIYVVNDGSGTLVNNTVFYENVTSAIEVALYSSGPTVSYSDFYANGSDFVGMWNLVGYLGNENEDPEFVDAANNLFLLDPNSSLIDDGDPAILDRDGTRSDMGLYGGPKAD